jgi:anti-sigma regulatory factor (Ser/Thr protein kinase)
VKKKRKIVIPAQIKYLAQIRSFIDYVGRVYHYSSKDINATKLAVEEACTNIMRHGYRDLPNGEITIKILIRRLSMTVILIDQGQSFDPRRVNKPDLLKYVEMGKMGGLGIMMIRKLMDDLQYNVTDEGNEFYLIKYRERFKNSILFKVWHLFKARRSNHLTIDDRIEAFSP